MLVSRYSWYSGGNRTALIHSISGRSPKRQVCMRRQLQMCAFVVAMGAMIPAVAAAQDPAVPAKPVLTINSAAAVVTVLIKPDKTADFDLVLAKLKQALANSTNPQRKAQAAGWKVFKSPPIQGNAVYVMRIDPVIRGAEYDITRLIAEVFPVEVLEIFEKYKGAFAGRAITELTPFLSMQ